MSLPKGRNADKPPKKSTKDPLISLVKLGKINMALRAGNYIHTACEFAGISNSTFQLWRTRGEKELDRVESNPVNNLDSIFSEFEGIIVEDGEDVDKSTMPYMWHHRPDVFDMYEWPYVIFTRMATTARSEAVVRAVSSIMKAGATSWQAHAWWLERTRPDEYGRRDRVKLEGGGAGSDPIRTETVITVEQLNERLKQLGVGDGQD